MSPTELRALYDIYQPTSDQPLLALQPATPFTQPLLSHPNRQNHQSHHNQRPAHKQHKWQHRHNQNKSRTQNHPNIAQQHPESILAPPNSREFPSFSRPQNDHPTQHTTHPQPATPLNNNVVSTLHETRETQQVSTPKYSKDYVPIQDQPHEHEHQHIHSQLNDKTEEAQQLDSLAHQPITNIPVVAIQAQPDQQSQESTTPTQDETEETKQIDTQLLVHTSQHIQPDQPQPTQHETHSVHRQLFPKQQQNIRYIPQTIKQLEKKRFGYQHFKPTSEQTSTSQLQPATPRDFALISDQSSPSSDESSSSPNSQTLSSPDPPSPSASTSLPNKLLHSTKKYLYESIPAPVLLLTRIKLNSGKLEQVWIKGSEEVKRREIGA